MLSQEKQMTPQGTSFLKELESNYKKAAFYAGNYTHFNLPTVATEPLSLPSDSWNSGSNRRILIPAGAKIKLVSREDALSLVDKGVDADKLMGLWASEFEYNY